MKPVLITICLIFIGVLNLHAQFPSLKVNGTNANHQIAKAYRIAVGDVMSNTQLYHSSINDEEIYCLLAGLHYEKPWTRDAAINVWNGISFLMPDVAKNTLEVQLKYQDDQLIIGGQYWDKVIWSIGAWEYYQFNQDINFLDSAYLAIKNTIEIQEKEEYSVNKKLFRGAAVYGDGVSAYPKFYTESEISGNSDKYSAIYEWVDHNPSRKNKIGYGLPMYVLSTNLVYYKTYDILSKIAEIRDPKMVDHWTTKKEELKETILREFKYKDGKYYYLLDEVSNHKRQESMGLAFLILFDVIDDKEGKEIIENANYTEAGVPCVYPSYARHTNKKLSSYGRHAGTVWPHIQGFWGSASKKVGSDQYLYDEFLKLSQHAVRDNHFYEIYHPETTNHYGGVQEPTLSVWEEWFCAERQSWSATAYLRMLYFDILGLDISEEGLCFKPSLPSEVDVIELERLVLGNKTLNLKINGSGNQVQKLILNGKEVAPNYKIPSDWSGILNIEITLN